MSQVTSFQGDATHSFHHFKVILCFYTMPRVSSRQIQNWHLAQQWVKCDTKHYDIRFRGLLCWVLIMLSVVYAECCLCWVLFCCVTNKSLVQLTFCWGSWRQIHVATDSYVIRAKKASNYGKNYIRKSYQISILRNFNWKLLLFNLMKLNLVGLSN